MPHVVGNFTGGIAPRSFRADAGVGQPSIGGSAYIFERQRNSWIETKKLLPSDGAPLNGFGAYIEADSNSVLVGGELSKGEGAAYLFSVRGAVP
jgi:FG-GAP repeat